MAEQLLGQGTSFVHVSVVGIELDVVLETHAVIVSHVLVVEIRVQHDDRETQAIGHVRIDQLLAVRALLKRMDREGLFITPERLPHFDDAVDLLTLSGKTEALKEHAESRQHVAVAEVERSHVFLENRLVQILVLPQVLSNLLLVQQRRGAQEASNLPRRGILRHQSYALFQPLSPTTAAQKLKDRLILVVESRNGLHELVALENVLRGSEG